MLMVIYGIDAPAALDLVRWRSQEGNVKLRILAEQVVSDFMRLTQSEKTPARSPFDNLLLTADRIAGREGDTGPTHPGSDP